MYVCSSTIGRGPFRSSYKHSLSPPLSCTSSFLSSHSKIVRLPTLQRNTTRNRVSIRRSRKFSSKEHEKVKIEYKPRDDVSPKPPPGGPRYLNLVQASSAGSPFPCSGVLCSRSSDGTAAGPLQWASGSKLSSALSLAPTPMPPFSLSRGIIVAAQGTGPGESRHASCILSKALFIYKVDVGTAKPHTFLDSTLYSDIPYRRTYLLLAWWELFFTLLLFSSHHECSQQFHYQQTIRCFESLPMLSRDVQLAIFPSMPQSHILPIRSCRRKTRYGPITRRP